MRVLSFALLLAGLALVAAPRSAPADDFKPEPGYVLLFNGKNLDGWKTQKGEALEGKTEAYKGRFKVSGGELVIDPKVRGDVKIFTTKALKGDLSIKFEFFPG